MAHDPSLDDETYDKLRRLAHKLKGRSFDATIQPTALLHEAWMKVSRGAHEYTCREHFQAVAARAMRQILVDRARKRLSQKRGGGWQQVTLSGVGGTSQDLGVLDLDEALKALARVDRDASEVAQMRAFGGMSVPEVAAAMGVSESTVARKWRFARVFLLQRLES